MLSLRVIGLITNEISRLLSTGDTWPIGLEQYLLDLRRIDYE